MMRNTSGKFGVPKTLVALLVIAAIVVGSAYFFKFGAQTLVGGSPGQPAPTPAVTDFNACKHFTVVGSTSMSGSTQGVPGKSVELAVDYGSASDVTDPQFYASRGWLVNSKSSWSFSGSCSSGSLSVSVCNQFPQYFPEQSFSNGVPTVGLYMFEQCPGTGSANGAYCTGTFTWDIYLAKQSNVNCAAPITPTSSTTSSTSGTIPIPQAAPSTGSVPTYQPASEPLPQLPVQTGSGTSFNTVDTIIIVGSGLLILAAGFVIWKAV